MTWRQLPNVLTVLRMVAAVPLLYALEVRAWNWALGLAFAAGMSDGLDGWLAKRYDWQSRLGGLLDPLADKVLLNTCYLVLWSVGELPAWLALLVIGRDVAILGGALAWHWWIRPLDAQPSRLSKLTTAMQIGLVVLWLLHLVGWTRWPAVLEAGMWMVAAVTLASGLDYVVRWGARALQQRRQA